MFSAISVIIPTYNREKLLPRCIESVLNQTFTDFEVIIVDDGSKDASEEIYNSYAQKDSRIKIIKQPNGGVTAARANGVKNASGEWICFIDSDDYIPNDSLSNLYKDVSDDLAMVIGCINSTIKEEVLSPKTTIRQMLLHKIPSSPWGRLIRRDLFDDKTFNIPREIVRAEDLIMNIRLLLNTKKEVKLINTKVYNYEIITESGSSQFRPTIAFEDLLYKYKMNSFPIEQRKDYIHELIYNNIEGLWGLALAEETNLGWKNSNFYNWLLQDIKNYNYQLTTPREKALFGSKLHFIVYRIYYKLKNL